MAVSPKRNGQQAIKGLVKAEDSVRLVIEQHSSAFDK